MKAKRPAGHNPGPIPLQHSIGTSGSVMFPGGAKSWPSGPPTPNISRGNTNLAAFSPSKKKR